MGFGFFRGATRERRDSKEFKSEIDSVRTDSINKFLMSSNEVKGDFGSWLTRAISERQARDERRPCSMDSLRVH